MKEKKERKNRRITIIKSWWNICHQSNEKFAGESTHHQSELDNVFFV